MKATNIQWNVDSKEELEYLPTELKLPDHIESDDYDEIDDYLSNVTGFCHAAYDLED